MNSGNFIHTLSELRASADFSLLPSALMATLAAPCRKAHSSNPEIVEVHCNKKFVEVHCSRSTKQETVADLLTPCLACPKMTPLSREEHTEIMRETDFVIPVKDVGPFMRAVVEAVASIYTPRRIIFIAETDVLDHINKLASAWDLPHTTCFAFVYEETFFHGLAESSSLPASVWTKEGLRARFDVCQSLNTRTGCFAICKLYRPASAAPSIVRSAHPST